jgi:hypothetical protein
MAFDTLTDVENFYKAYAHEVGFSVRVGQHKKQKEEILFNRNVSERAKSTLFSCHKASIGTS